MRFIAGHTDEPQTRFVLTQSGLNVRLRCVDCDGDEWDVLQIDKDGNLMLADSIGGITGLNLNREGAIEVRKERI